MNRLAGDLVIGDCVRMPGFDGKALKTPVVVQTIAHVGARLLVTACYQGSDRCYPFVLRPTTSLRLAVTEEGVGNG